MVTAKTYHPYPAILVSRRVNAKVNVLNRTTWILIYSLILTIFCFMLFYLYQSVENKELGFYLQGLLKEKVVLAQQEQRLRTEIEKLHQLERINKVIETENIVLDPAVYSTVVAP